MKWIIAILVAVGLGFLVYGLTGKKRGASKKTPPNNSSTVKSTGTHSTPFPAFYPGWNGFTTTSLQNVGAARRSNNRLLTFVSNTYGKNDGGRNKTSAQQGSNNGGLASSGSGVGLATNQTNQVQNPGNVPVKTLYGTALLNGFMPSNGRFNVQTDFA